jgi:hypothetical protein
MQIVNLKVAMKSSASSQQTQAQIALRHLIKLPNSSLSPIKNFSFSPCDFGSMVQHAIFVLISA